MSTWYIQCKPCTYLASRLALSRTRPNRAPPDTRQLGVPSGASKTIYEPMVRLTQTEHLSYTDANTVSKTDWNKIPYDSRHLGVPSVASNTISKPSVRSPRSSISKRSKASFHLVLITQESHRVCPKWFLCISYVRCKPCMIWTRKGLWSIFWWEAWETRFGDGDDVHGPTTAFQAAP
jgi:hypothetical protein